MLHSAAAYEPPRFSVAIKIYKLWSLKSRKYLSSTHISLLRSSSGATDQCGLWPASVLEPIGSYLPQNGCLACPFYKSLPLLKNFPRLSLFTYRRTLPYNFIQCICMYMQLMQSFHIMLIPSLAPPSLSGPIIFFSAFKPVELFTGFLPPSPCLIIICHCGSNKRFVQVEFCFPFSLSGSWMSCLVRNILCNELTFSR